MTEGQRAAIDAIRYLGKAIEGLTECQFEISSISAIWGLQDAEENIERALQRIADYKGTIKND